MKSRKYILIMRSLVTVGAFALVLNGCSKGSQNNRRLGDNGNYGAPMGYNGPNGTTNVNPANLPQCTPAAAAANYLYSPLNPQGPCYNAQMAAQAQQQNIQNPNQQPQQQVGPNGQPLVPPSDWNQGNQQAVLPNYGIPKVSVDIPVDNGVGRIVGRHFQLSYGVGIQDADDNCVNTSENLQNMDEDDIRRTGKKTQYHWARFLYPVNSPISRNLPPDRFDLKFAPDGTLTASANSLTGAVSAVHPIKPVKFTGDNLDPYTYALDPETQTLRIGAFTMTGPPSGAFKDHEKFLSTVLRKEDDIETKDRLGIKGPLPEEVSRAFSSGTGNSGINGFTVGQGSGSSNNSSQNLGKPGKTSPDVITLTIANFEAQIGILPSMDLQHSTQHITGLLAREVPWDGTTYVDTINGLDRCAGTAHGEFQNLFLK